MFPAMRRLTRPVWIVSLIKSRRIVVCRWEREQHRVTGTNGTPRYFALVDDVVDGALDGIQNGGFLIPVGPGVVEAFQAKAGDYDAFLGNMQQKVRSLGANG
jgi:hypothetical protein